MRPLQRWLHDRVPRWAWRHGTYRVPRWAWRPTARTGSQSPRPAATPSAHGRTLLSSGRSSPRASIQVYCCSTDASTTGWGGHVQRACSCGALDRAPAAVAYQLPRVAGSMACSAPLQNAATREACTGPYGQHCDRCVHQPPRRSTLPSHVVTRLPSPPLESEASVVASRRSCPRRAQSCSRRALMSARPSGSMATPPRGTPADFLRRFGDAQVDLFASPDTSHCQLFFKVQGSRFLYLSHNKLYRV